jgi:Protein of unknown function (DUF1549)
VNPARPHFLWMAAAAILAIITASSMCSAADGADRTAARLPAEMARQVDTALAAELAGPADSPTAANLIDEQGFVRRVSQDLLGELPTPEEVTAFVLDPSADKRSRLVERLLADPRFGQSWGRYFRDVILYRRTDERALLASSSLATFLAEQFNQGVGWDRIARAFITAQGDIREHGETGLIMAQMGQAAEIAAETARIFLGVQIQCAQCHDHPTDRWKRTQFHELAARQL